jgi:predicted DNA-binding transcriptional regulator AlpA
MLSFAAACRRVDRAPGTIKRWIEVNEFPRPIMINGRRYYAPEQIDRWLDNIYASTGLTPADNGSPARA